MFKFAKKETPVQNIAFMSIMAAINVIFALLMAFIPYIMFLLILILPMTSVLVALYCKARYYPLYIIVTLGLCFVSAIWDPSIALFYILPSMITGFLFALFMHLKMPNIYLIIVPSLIELGFAYLSVYLSYLLTNINLIETFKVILNLQDFEYYYSIIPSIFLLISLIQELFSYMIIKDELIKFGYEIKEENDHLFWANTIVIFDLLTLTLITGIMQIISISYLALILSSILGLDLCLKSCQNKNKLMIILNAVTAGLTILIFGVCYQYLNPATSFLLFGIFYFMTTIYAILNKTLFTHIKMIKISKDNKD